LHFLPPEDNAYYYIAFTIAGILFIIPTAFSISLYAEGSFKEETFILNMKKALKQTYLLLIPSVIFLIIFGDKLLSLFGSEYSTRGQLLLSILAISSLFLPLNTFYNTYLRIHLKMLELLFISIMNTTALLCATYFLLQTMGLIGIGVANIITSVAVSVYIIFRIKMGKLVS
jgi:O-antigen/teichoic acid export membrane protein